MASKSKSDASRANGAKSKGPTTPEGKARSSQNALKHGLTSQLETLPGESDEDLEALLADYETRYQPVGAAEQDLVHTLAQTRWRLRRVPTLEFNVFDNEMILSEEDIEEDFSEIGDPGRLGFVFKKLADNSQALSLLIRYETSLTRIHDRTFKHLTALQKLRNEPKPVPPATPLGPIDAPIGAPCVSVGLVVEQSIPPAVPTSSPPSTPQSPSQPAGHADNRTAMRNRVRKKSVAR